MIKRPMCIVLIGLMIGIGLLQMLGMAWVWRSPTGPILENSENGAQKIKASGIVYQQENKSYQNKKYSYIYLTQTILTIDQREYPIRNIKCIIEEEQESLLEEHITVIGYLDYPKTATNPGEFDLQGWERARKIDYYLEKCQLCEILQNKNGLLSILENLKTQLIEKINEVFPEETAGILIAMLLGSKELLSEDITDGFQAAGISHIMAISGLHISLIGIAVWSGLQWLGMPITASVIISLFSLIGYMVLIGNPTTALRAFIMFLMMLFVKLLGRTYDKVSALSVAGILLLLDNPDLLFHCGFQLSFMAVVGIGIFAEVMEDLYETIIQEKRLRIFKDVRMGIFLWFFTLPIVVFHFYQVSIVGILCNLLVIPLLPVALGITFIALLIGFWHVGIGSVIAIPAYLVIKLYIWLGEMANRIPWGIWTPGKPHIVTIVIYYSIIVVLWLGAYYIRYKESFVKKNKTIICISYLSGYIILLLLISHPWKNENQITLLDVGQGDGIILQTDGYTTIIDGGSSNRSNVGKNVIIPYLKHQGISHVELIIVTHSDQDHMNGIVELLEEARKGWLKIQTICMPTWMRDTEDGLELEILSEQTGIIVEYVQRGDRILMGESTFTVLHPNNNDFSENPNAGSLVILYETNTTRGLFMGDLPSEQETSIIDDIPPCDYIKIGHHGSNDSTTSELLEITSPKIALISCGKNNQYGHPGEKLLERLRGILVFRTDKQGAITIIEKDLAQIK